jgi:hypothetical protein
VVGHLNLEEFVLKAQDKKLLVRSKAWVRDCKTRICVCVDPYC